MTKLEQYRDIAKRLEAATGPDWKIDKRIALLFSLGWDYSADWGPRGCDSPVAFEYSASIDAALALVEKVLPGWITSSANQAVNLGDSNPTWFWELDNPRSPDTTPQGRSAPTAPLAIMKAIFAALIAQEEER